MEPGSMCARQAFYHLGIPSPQHVTSPSGFWLICVTSVSDARVFQITIRIVNRNLTEQILNCSSEEFWNFSRQLFHEVAGEQASHGPALKSLEQGCTNTHMHAHTHTQRMHTLTCTYMWTHVIYMRYTRSHVHIHACPCICIYTCAHTHQQLGSFLWLSKVICLVTA